VVPQYQTKVVTETKKCGGYSYPQPQNPLRF